MVRPVTRIRGHYAADGGFRKGKGAAVICEEAYIEESDGSAAGVYTASIAIPAGATILDVKVRNTALWDAGTSATMIVGDDDDPNGFYDAIDMKATDLVVGEELNFMNLGGKPGVYLVAATGHRDAYRATANNVIAEITTVGTLGTAGKTLMQVIYQLPYVQTPATFVAS